MKGFSRILIPRDLILINILAQNFQACIGQVITVFRLGEFHGSNANVSISTCNNLPKFLQKNVYSVHTHNNCVRLYGKENCDTRGHFIEVLARSPSHNDLTNWDFGKKAVSAGPCPDACSTEITGRPMGETVIVELFPGKSFRGRRLKIIVDGCTQIPKSFINKTASVQTNGHCIQLYNTPTCNFSSPDVDSIELRRGTPFHYALEAWHFPHVLSISHCNHKCKTFVSESLSLPLEDEVYLFHAKYYGGIYYKLNMSSRDCINLPVEWEGLTESIAVLNTSCVQIFNQTDCMGKRLNVTASVADLSVFDFDGITRSIKCCVKRKTDVFEQSTVASVSEKPQTTTTTDKPIGNNLDILSPLIITVISVVPVVGMLLTAVLILLVLRRCHPYKQILEKLPEKEIQEFLSGYGMNIQANQSSPSANPNEYSIELLAQNKPYNEEYEIPRSRIQFDDGAPLGAGEFGTVYKGTVSVVSVENEPTTSSNSKTKKITVAIKTVNSSAGLHGLRSLLKEVKVMLYLGQNTNIAYMIGCCTENLRQGEIMVLMEYCSGGSLESYLQKNRPSFKNLVHKGRLEVNEASAVNLGLLTNTSEKCSNDQAFDIFVITKWSFEIARGMEFLSKAKVVHSDLAARNILLTDKLNAKISDFGLSRQLYSYSQYMKKQQEPLPWRWMALESLKSLEFSTKSDVWSYGILCWEMFTLGEKPYSGLAWNESFISNLEGGLRPNKPRNATNEFYNLMLQCWEESTVRRPSFTEIIEEIEEVVANFVAASESLIVL